MGSVCHGYICILLYRKLIQCSGVQRSLVNWRRGVGSVCHGYMCILLYITLMQCYGVAWMCG